MNRIISRSLLVFVSTILPSLSFAESTLAIKADAPKTYTVVKGDTLWDISAMYLDSPWLWPRLWQANDYIENPHLIYPGDKLNLIWLDGKPVLTLKPMVRLGPKVRVQNKEAVTAMADSLLLPYLEFNRLVSDDDLKHAIRVLGSSNGNKYLSADALLYISGQHKQTDWGIFHPEQSFTRDNRKVTVLKQVAWAELKSTGTDMTGLQVTKQLQEIMVDDIALPLADKNVTESSLIFYPQPAPSDMEVKILGSIEGTQYVAENQVLVIDRGASDGLVQGSTFSLFEQGNAVRSIDGQSSQVKQAAESKIQLPDYQIGSLMVIRDYDFFSLAIITESLQPIGQKTLVRAPVAVNE